MHLLACSVHPTGWIMSQDVPGQKEPWRRSDREPSCPCVRHVRLGLGHERFAGRCSGLGAERKRWAQRCFIKAVRMRFTSLTETSSADLRHVAMLKARLGSGGGVRLQAVLERVFGLKCSWAGQGRMWHAVGLTRAECGMVWV